MKLIFTLLLSFITLNSVLSQIKMDVWGGGKNTSKTFSTPVQAKNLPKVFESKLPDGTVTTYERLDRPTINVTTSGGKKFTRYPIVYRDKKNFGVVTYSEKGWMGVHNPKNKQSYSMLFGRVIKEPQNINPINCQTIFSSKNLETKKTVNTTSSRSQTIMSATSTFTREDFYDSSKVIPVTCDLYTEIAYDVYQRFNGDLDAIQIFYELFYESVSYFFQREGITLIMNDMHIWENMDPYGYTLPTNFASFVTIQTFRNNKSNSIPRSTNSFFKQLVCGINTPSVSMSGVGYQSANSNGYSLDNPSVETISNIRMSFFYDLPNPINDFSYYNFAIGTSCHEIGHNLGASHTNVCGFWRNENNEDIGRLDSCGYSCVDGSGGPAKQPTSPKVPSIMGQCYSYPSTTPPYYSLPDYAMQNGFGRLPRFAIRSNLYLSRVSSLNFFNIEISEASSITFNSVKIKYRLKSIDSSGQSEFSTRGLVWSTNPNPTISLNTKTIDPITPETQSIDVTGLLPNNTYYVRAYCRKSDNSLIYSNQISFKTTNNPSVTFQTVVNPNQNNYDYKVNGKVIGNGGQSIDEVGYCYRPFDGLTPTIENSNVGFDNVSSIISINEAFESGLPNGPPSFSLSLTNENLTPNTKYKIRTYARNQSGIGYSDVSTFTSQPLVTVDFIEPNQLISTQFNLQCKYFIWYPSLVNVESMGVIWSTSPNDLTIDLPTKTSRPGINQPSVTFTETVTGLLPFTTYHYIVYVRLTNGTVFYSRKENILSANVQTPSFTSTTLSRSTSQTTVSHIVTSLFDRYGITESPSDIIEKGVVYSTEPNPTAQDGVKIINTSPISNKKFITTLNFPLGQTVYYARPYALNIEGYGYGQELVLSNLRIPELSTTPPSTISPTTLQSGGIITSGDAPITYGIIWSTSSSTVLDVSLPTKTIDSPSGGGTVGSFTSTINNIVSGTTYYLRAYATNSSGTSYGQTYTFTLGLPVISTLDVYIPNTTLSAGGEIQSDGGSPITKRGIVYSSISSEPTLTSPTPAFFTENGSGTGTFTDIITSGIVTGTQYWMRAYATNQNGTSYGNVISKKACSRNFSIFQQNGSAGSTSMPLLAQIPECGPPVISRGFVASTTPNPTTDSPIKIVSGSGYGFFNNTLTGLQEGTLYHFRAFYTTELSTTYSENRTIPTNPLVTSNVITATSTSAEITSTAYNSTFWGPVEQRGVVWSTSPNPTFSLPTKLLNGPGSGSFNTTISNLLPGTIYYFKGFGIWSFLTFLSDQSSFITLPSITTQNITSVTQNSAVSGGSVNAGGGGWGQILSRGVVWSTNSGPTINLPTKTVDGSGNGNFSSTLTGLLPNTTYYVRSYLVTDIDFEWYGQELSFTTTASVPLIKTDETGYISATSGFSGGIILNSGTSPIIKKGVVWSEQLNPSINLTTKTNDGSGSNNFSSNILGLGPNTTYYVRAYMTNNSGTFYGDNKTFKTPAGGTGTCVIEKIDVTEQTKGWEYVFNLNPTCPSYQISMSKYRQNPIQNPNILPEYTTNQSGQNPFIPTSTDVTNGFKRSIMKPQPSGDPLTGTWWSLNIKCNTNCVGGNNTTRHYFFVPPP